MAFLLRKTPFLLYGLIGGSYVLLHDIFIIYFIDAFVNGFGISVKSFIISELIFLIWNSLNDLLFSLYIDSYIHKGCKDSTEIIVKRLKIIKYSSVFFSLIFSLMWKDFLFADYPGFRFGLYICIYDTFLTLINQQHDALLSDMSINQKVRITFGSYSSFFQAISAFGVVFISWKIKKPYNETISGLGDAFLVQIDYLALLCGSISFIASFLLIDLVKSKKVTVQSGSIAEKPSDEPIFRYFFSLLRIKNFTWLVLTQTLQIFNCHFNSNFFPILVYAMLDKSLQDYAYIILGISFLLPHVNNYYLLKLSTRIGVYSVIRVLIFIKVVIALITFLFGYNSTYLIVFFIISNRIFTEGVCKIFNQMTTYLVDEDFVVNNRENPLSSVVLGTTSFFSKPGQTMAPIVGVFVISSLLGNNICSDGDCSQTLFEIMSDKYRVTSESEDLLKRASFLASTILTMATGLFQLLFWNQLTLRGNYLKELESLRYKYSTSPKRNFDNLV